MIADGTIPPNIINKRIGKYTSFSLFFFTLPFYDILMYIAYNILYVDVFHTPLQYSLDGNGIRFIVHRKRFTLDLP